jgi:hypothetical protein
MSDHCSYPRGKHTPQAFILPYLHAVFKETFHTRWLPAEQLRTYTHMKCNIEDEIRFSQAAMMRVINKKMLPLVGTEPNIIEGTAGGVNRKGFWHSFYAGSR